MVRLCVEAEHMHKGSTQNLWRMRNSIYLFQIRVTAPLSSHRSTISKSTISPATGIQTQISLPSLLGNGSSPVPKGCHQREPGYHCQKKGSRQIHTSVTSLQKPQYSRLLYPGRNLGCGGLWPCWDIRDKHFPVSQFQLGHLWLRH